MPRKTDAFTDLLTKTENRVYARVKWNGGKVLLEAVQAYKDAIDVFLKKNNLNATQVSALKKDPQEFLNSASVSVRGYMTPRDSRIGRDAAVRIGVAESIGLAENAGRVRATARVSQIKTAAVTKRVATKSK